MMMADELPPLDISRANEVRRLVAEVQASEQARALQINQQMVAILAPARSGQGTAQRGKATSASDPLWAIVGLGQSDGPSDVAENIDTYLA